MQDSQTLAVKAPLTTLWVLMTHEIQHPEDYAAKTALFSCKKVSDDKWLREVSRHGTRYQETVEVNPDAQMVEQTWQTRGKRPLKLILQLVPIDGGTLLNLAANVVANTEDESDETLTDPELPDLIEIAENIKKRAQAL